MKIFRIFTLIAAALICGNASAQKLTADNVSIKPNGDATIVVKIDAEAVQCATNFTITLPEGITADVSDKTKFPGELIDDHSLDVTPSGQDVDVIIYSSNITNFKAASGVVFNLPIKAGDIATGTLKCKIHTITISDADENEVQPDDVEFDITVEAAAYVEPEGTHQIEGGLGSLVAPKTYENIGAWGGTWSGNSIENERDWSKFDYLWIKYKDFSGAINFGIMYSEWLASQSWGDQFYDENVAISDPSGVIGIKINHEKVYEKGNAETDGAYIGDIYSKHIREIFIQATSGGSNITIEEMWLGSEEDYLKAVEDNKWVDPTVYANIVDDKCYFSKEYPSTDIVASTVEDGVIVVTSPAKVSQDWDTQFWVWMTQKLPAGTKFKVSFECKASAETTIGTQYHNNPGDYVHYESVGNINVTTDWQPFEATKEVPSAVDGKVHENSTYLNEFHSLAFNLTKTTDITYYFKNIKIEIDETAVTEAEYFEPAPPTGIKSLNTAEKNGVLYNLAGQKVDKNFKGIVIENGKKRMNK